MGHIFVFILPVLPFTCKLAFIPSRSVSICGIREESSFICLHDDQFSLHHLLNNLSFPPLFFWCPCKSYIKILYTHTSISEHSKSTSLFCLSQHKTRAIKTVQHWDTSLYLVKQPPPTPFILLFLKLNQLSMDIFSTSKFRVSLYRVASKEKKSNWNFRLGLN